MKNSRSNNIRGERIRIRVSEEKIEKRIQEGKRVSGVDAWKRLGAMRAAGVPFCCSELEGWAFPNHILSI